MLHRLNPNNNSGALLAFFEIDFQNFQELKREKGTHFFRLLEGVALCCGKQPGYRSYIRDPLASSKLSKRCTDAEPKAAMENTIREPMSKKYLLCD
jgi:hypothetical protein